MAVTKTTDKAKQATLKAVYADLLAKEVWGRDQRMIDHCMKKISRIVELADGSLVVLEKPEIKTRFCFGYSLSSESSEDYDRANAAAESVNEQYFIEENMDTIGWEIERLTNPHFDGLYIIPTYTRSPRDSRLCSVVTPISCRGPESYWKPLSDADRQTIIEAWEAEKIVFRKRLDAYLKRYGLSKIETWSYWQDE